MGGVREWLMRLVAGRRPYWIADEAASQFASLKRGVLGAGAAIALVHSLREAEVTSAEFIIDGWTVTAKRPKTEADD